MAQNLNEMLQEIVNRPYEQKVLGAKATLAECFDIMNRKGVDQKQSAVLVITFLAAAVAADGKFSSPERKMLKEMFGDDLEAIVKSIDKKTLDLVDQFVDTFNAAEKSNFILLAIYVMAVDDTINKDELTYLIKLMQ